MRTTCWNDAEDEALQGLPLAAQLLYLRGLRRYMDYRTGLVGAGRRRISWQMLSEVLEVEHRQGMAGWRADKQRLRRLVAWLVKAGLVEQRNDGRYLVFRLPLADADQSASKKAVPRPYHLRTTSPDHVRTTCDPQEDLEFDEQGAEGRTTSVPPDPEKSVPHPGSGIDLSLPDGSDRQTPPAERVPYQAIVDLYHEVLPELPAVVKLTEARKRQIRARWKSGDLDCLEGWRKYFGYVRQSSFLMGRGRPRGEGATPWRASFDWLIQERNVIRVWEGHYDDAQEVARA